PTTARGCSSGPTGSQRGAVRPVGSSRRRWRRPDQRGPGAVRLSSPNRRTVVTSRLQAWPRFVATCLAILPVLALALIVTTTTARSLAPLAQIGVADLPGPDLISPFVRATNVMYGLQGPVWGTVLVPPVAVGLALPAALAMAICATELRIPVLSNALSGVLGTLAGIPPIIYALGAFFLVQTFMAPKFSAVEINDPRLKAVLQGLPTFSQI